MNDEISIHAAPRPAVRRMHPRTWLGLGIGAIALLLGAAASFVIGAALYSRGPDTLQLISVTPASGNRGRFALQFRLRRTDGAPVGASISTMADLLDVQTGKQLLNRQCGFRVEHTAKPGSMDVVLTDLTPASVTKPRRVRATIHVRMLSPREGFDFALWKLSGMKLPQPMLTQTGWRTFSHELDLPPAAPTSPTDRE